MSTAVVTSKGQVTIPHDIRQQLNIHKGDKLNFIVTGEHSCKIIPASIDIHDLIGCMQSNKPAPTIEQMDSDIMEQLQGK